MKRIYPTIPVRKAKGGIPQWELPNACYHVRFSVRRGYDLTPDERKIVLDECVYWHNKRYQLFAVAVMPDHVHIVIRPIQDDKENYCPLSKIVGGIKGYTARRINQSRARRGSIWLRKYYSRILRTKTDLKEKITYVVNNPVKAGLVDNPPKYTFLWAEGQPPG